MNGACGSNSLPRSLWKLVTTSLVSSSAAQKARTHVCASETQEGPATAGALLRTPPVFAVSVLLLFFLCPGKAQGQVTFDSASSADTGTGTAGSLTWSHTVGAAGTNRILIVGVSIRSSASQTVSSVIYAGTNLTLVGVIDNPTNARVEIWRLLAPVTGANNIIVTLSGNARLVGGASSFTGVHQTTPLGAFFSNTSNTPTPTVNVTGVAANEIVIDTIANANLNTATASPCVGTGQTQRWSDRTTSGTAANNTPGAGSTEPGPAGGGNVTMSWTLQGCAGATNRQWAIGAVALKPAPPPPPTFSISGTVFEDLNYGGGAGRSLVSSSGVVRANARVELYNASGNFVSFTTTNAAGVYTFSGQLAANYSVRVVNSTATSSRPGYVATLMPVQTFRTDASTGAAVADPNRVGGEEPSKVDAAANTTSATLASLTTGTTTAQSVSPIAISSSNVTGMDFGFNFDTVVNTNNAGQGSLRQFITNSNALTNGGLAQAGFAAGIETSIFMIPDGGAHSGLRSGLVNQLTGGVAIVALTSLLPQITNASTVIDGSTQTNNVGNTNSGSMGTGGAVGVDGLSLQTVNRPEVQIADNGNLAVGLDVQASSVTVRGLAIYGFGTVANSDAHGNIRIGNNYMGALIELNILGASATSFSDPGAGARSVGDNIRSAGGDSGTVRNNLIGFSTGKGIQLGGGATGWLIEGNEVRNNGIGNSNLDGIDIENGSGGNTVRGNSFSGNEAAGIDMYQSSGTNTVENNTLSGNGIGPGANVETPGVRIYGAGNRVDRNIINANFGAGVMVTSGSTGNLITRNSIYGNGPTNNQIGIDLLSASDNQSTGTAPFVTINDSGDGDAGGNNRLNYPVLLTATVLAGNLTLTGYARPGSAIELFIAQGDPSGFGEGRTYLVTLTEGSASDTDATTGTYTNPVNGLNQGTDTTNRFSFTIPVPAGVSNGTFLTATATLSNNTSEFSGNITVAAGPPNLGLVKSVDVSGAQVPGTDLTYTLAYANTGGQPATNLIMVDPNILNVDPLERVLRNLDYKVGSMSSNPGTTGLVATFEYSNDGGSTWTYTPVSGGGGAPAGYDRDVTNLRWSLTGNLSHLAPSNSGSVGFTVRIR